MTYIFPSAAWLDALKDQLNHDEKYARIAKNWEGDIVFDIEPEGGLTAPVKLYIDLWHGACRQVFEVDAAKEAQISPAYTLRASYTNFRRILDGQLDPMQAMITRKLRVQGSMSYMMRNIPVVLDFVRCAQEIDSQYV